jgi:hypothetical protein
VVVGDVHRALGFRNRVPLVCMALKAQKFLNENQLILKNVEGPPSGLSTTLRLTYEIVESAAASKPENPLWNLRGAAREIFRSLGGGEAFIRKERESFRESFKDRPSQDSK